MTVPSQRRRHEMLTREEDFADASNAYIERLHQDAAMEGDWTDDERETLRTHLRRWSEEDLPALLRARSADEAMSIFHDVARVVWDRSRPRSDPETLGSVATRLFGDAHALDRKVVVRSARGKRYVSNARYVFLVRFLFWRSLYVGDAAGRGVLRGRVIGPSQSERSAREGTMRKLRVRALKAIDVDDLIYGIDVLRNPVASYVTAIGVHTDRAALEEVRKAGLLLNMPAYTLARTRVTGATNGVLFVVENPNVLIELVERLSAATLPGRKWPTVVCTSGHGSVPALRLIEKLVRTGLRCVRLSSDEDTSGDEILQRVVDRIVVATVDDPARRPKLEPLATYKRWVEPGDDPRVTNGSRAVAVGSADWIEEHRVPAIWTELVDQIRVPEDVDQEEFNSLMRVALLRNGDANQP